jgi:general secretion pathway protein F
MAGHHHFHVRIFDAGNATVREETIEATSEAHVEALVTGTGAVALSVTRLQVAKPSAGQRSQDLDVAWWCRELRTLLVAGMTVVEAIETLHAQSMRRERSQVHEALLNRLRQGITMSGAMQDVGVFPTVLVAGVRASERTSSLVQALDDYLRYHEMLDRLRKQVVSAAIYPAVVVGLGLVITLFLLLFVMPRFAQMYSDLHGNLSVATRVMVSLSRVLNEHLGWVMASLVALGAGALVAWRHGVVAKLARLMAVHVGPLRRRLDDFRLAKLYHSIALMFRGGYALDEALSQCEAMFATDTLSRDMVGAAVRARRGLERGQHVSAAFTEAGLTDEVSERLLAVGERGGDFERVLQTIAERHAARFATFVERATRIVEPVLLLMVALSVGAIVVMMYMPVFDIASSIQ